MRNKIDEAKYRELTVKIDMIIDFLNSQGGIGYEMYSFECCVSGEEVSFDIVDVAMDIKHQIDFFYHDDDDFLF